MLQAAHSDALCNISIFGDAVLFLVEILLLRDRAGVQGLLGNFCVAKSPDDGLVKI